jgi:hypothetical protein
VNARANVLYSFGKEAGMDEGIMRIKKGNVMGIPQGTKGCRVSCLSGILWLTQENDPEDYIITPDSAHVIVRQGRSVIEAITDCTVCIMTIKQGELNDHA